MKRYLFVGIVASVVCFLIFNRTSENAEYDYTDPFNTAQPGRRDQPEKYCKWIFDRYESSAFEQEWLSLVTTGGVNDNVCAKVAEPHHAGHITEIMGRLAHLVRILDGAIKWENQDTGKPQPPPAADNLFSRFHYKRICFVEKDHVWRHAPGHGVQLIEPLFGMLRDPYDIWCAKKKLKSPPGGYYNDVHAESTQHILPMGFAPYAYTTTAHGKLEEWRMYGIPPWHSSYRPEPLDGVKWTYSPPRNMHIDVGASNFASTPNAPKWVYDRYQARGQPFDKFIAIHGDMADAKASHSDVPADLIGPYQVLGMSLFPNGFEYQGVQNVIRRTVKEEDFFVLKVHDNSREFSERFVKDLVSDENGLAKLIDEFYFEHKVKFNPMAAPWSLEDKHKSQVGDLSTSYKLFKDLRDRGIRAHSWP
ncbi:hypothetical protein BCR37DRAFT_376689 [Protomyces lactucae-debilis]|uniref:Uncharacterized protein n=1 Tax=Protomyces lactucae-debilis TaxID=2754530 RepID=A0A1Y2FQ74_PROLT|nr:uncharacterized protein BCR37DRAFT_376689 [Protomyces lactucae-debilis]ORY86143.1 hypothetical protein BCR37DRAFT_376689 [Protomyces lactucae-debilis]